MIPNIKYHLNTNLLLNFFLGFFPLILGLFLLGIFPEEYWGYVPVTIGVFFILRWAFFPLA